MANSTNDMYTDFKNYALARVDSKLDSLNGQSDHPAVALRRMARNALAQTQFPDRKNEDWKYTSVRPILTQKYREAVRDPKAPMSIPTRLLEDASRLVFIDGVYSRAHSDPLPGQVFFGTVIEAWEEPALKSIMQRISEEVESAEMEAFEALSLGLSPEPWVIHIPDEAVIDKPILLQYVTDAHAEPVAICPFLFVVAGKHSKATIVEHHASVSDTDVSHFTDTGQRIYLDDGAHLSHYRLQEEPRSALHTSLSTVVQEMNSDYGAFAAEIGGKLVRNNIHVIHRGTNIMTHLYGVFAAGDDQHIDTQSFIDHAFPHCESSELYKGVLQGRSRGVFNGKIIVRPDAQKTNAFQQNSTLVLSPHAVMDSKPQLEIFADDVKCSHGATIGELDETQIFYLRTRGLTRKQATLMLQKAFLQQVVDYFPHDDIAEAISARVDMKMQKLG